MGVSIRRENWNKKFRVVVRSKGKLVSYKAWSKKFTVAKAESLFKTNKTLNENIFRTKLKNVSEVVDTSDRPRKPRGQTGSYQYFVEGVDRKNNIRISARSRQFPLSVPAEEIKTEALFNFYQRYAQARGEDYDAQIGRKLFDDANGSITRQGFVYYTKLTDF